MAARENRAAGKVRRAKLLTGSANRHQFSMRSGIVRTENFVHACRQDFSIPHNDSTEGPTTALDVRIGKLECRLQELSRVID